MNPLGPDVATIRTSGCIVLFAWRQWLPEDLPENMNDGWICRSATEEEEKELIATLFSLS